MIVHKVFLLLLTSTAVVKNISKTIKLFCVKCEQAIKGDSDASQVVGRAILTKNSNRKTSGVDPNCTFQPICRNPQILGHDSKSESSFGSDNEQLF